MSKDHPDEAKDKKLINKAIKKEETRDDKKFQPKKKK